MEKVRYMISDAASIVNVESHVLRYWEDELDLNIPRNEMGHRYYTKENIQEFQRIKELKEQGYQLKAIRLIVHNKFADGEIPDPETVQRIVEQQSETANNPMKIHFVEPAAKTGFSQGGSMAAGVALQQNNVPQSVMDNTDKMAQFTELMTQIVGKALAANNQALSKNISEDVGEQVIKEMNYLMREREEAEEERFRKLDDAIRSSMKRKEGRKSKWKKRQADAQPKVAKAKKAGRQNRASQEPSAAV